MLNELECPVIPDLANELRACPKDDVSICRIVVKYYECISEFHWRPEPTPPEEYRRYLALSPKDKSIFRDQNTTFFVKGKVVTYLDARDMIRGINRRNFATLVSWFKLPVSENGLTPEEHAIVEKHLNTFSGKDLP